MIRNAIGKAKRCHSPLSSVAFSLRHFDSFMIEVRLFFGSFSWWKPFIVSTSSQNNRKPSVIWVYHLFSAQKSNRKYLRKSKCNGVVVLPYFNTFFHYSSGRNGINGYGNVALYDGNVKTFFVLLRLQVAKLPAHLFLYVHGECAVRT